MKKICAVLILVVLLCSCSGKNAVEPKLKGISFVAEISYYNEIYSCECTMSNEGSLSAKVTLPETLEGFTLKVDSNGVTAEYLGITYTPTDGNMPFFGIIEEFYQGLCEAEKAGVAKKTDDGYKITCGEGAEQKVLKITEAGLPITLLMPDERFYAEFYSVTILN